MEDLSLESRMTITNPTAIQLYSAATPNGIKVAAALEEIHDLRSTKEDFAYEPHTINIRMGENRREWFQNISPSSKIPAIIDPKGPGGKEVCVFESGSILLYLADKYHELLPHDGSNYRVEALNWLFWGSSAISSQFKLFGFYYKYCPHDLPYCVARYAKEAHRLLSVLEKQLEHGLNWIIGGVNNLNDKHITVITCAESLTRYLHHCGYIYMAMGTRAPRKLWRCL